MKVLNKTLDLNFYMTHAYQELGLLPFLLLPGLTYLKSFSQEQTCQMKECYATPTSWRSSSTYWNHGSLLALSIQFQTFMLAFKHLLGCKLLLIINCEMGLVRKQHRHVFKQHAGLERHPGYPSHVKPNLYSFMVGAFLYLKWLLHQQATGISKRCPGLCL